jgi:glyoxylase-like metal-dependent hydrolase (beta-lactamase superfamily II)
MGRSVPSCLNQPVVGPIDLHHQTERVIGVYLLETDEGPALFDCGPSTRVDALKAGLAERGLALTDVRHLLLSHIHLDHAGAAGSLVREHPGLQVHVSEIGAPHVVDPGRLEASARRLYGDAFDDLWGELAPVPEENVHVVGDRVLGLDCFPSPGHASHHVCYLHSDGTLYAGDAAGVRIVPGRHVLPVCPPPDIDVEAWFRTFEEIERRRPARLALIHFGVAESPSEHLALARAELAKWSERCAEGMDEDEWIDAASRDLEAAVGEEEAQVWVRAAPFWQSFAGMKRYWDKKAAAAA